VSGSEDFMKKYPAFLTLFGGNIKYLGRNARLASALDMASLSWLYGAYIGLIYGAALCQAAGLELPLYSSTISDITPGFTDFFKHQINRIDTGNFAISQSPLSISVGATQRIFEVAGEYQLNTEFPGIIAKLLKQADKMGLSGKELASVIAVVRPETVYK
jgi:3-hydroxyisobutyrate dehydrogenase-like beta-hydroxyacid dehydrogenase